MAVWVHKGEESALIDPTSLKNHLQAGWSVIKGDNQEPEKEPEKEPNKTVRAKNTK